MKTKPKRKLKSYTPITLAIPKAEQDKIKSFPRISLNSFKDKTNTPTDWYNVTFRCKVGLELAKAIYTEEAVEGMQTAIQACIEIKEHYHVTDIWEATESQIEAIELGIDATDEMQDNTLRRDQLSAHQLANLYMKKLVKG